MRSGGASPARYKVLRSAKFISNQPQTLMGCAVIAIKKIANVKKIRVRGLALGRRAMLPRCSAPYTCMFMMSV